MHFGINFIRFLKYHTNNHTHLLITTPTCNKLTLTVDAMIANVLSCTTVVNFINNKSIDLYYIKTNLFIFIVYTVEPLLMDTPYKGHNRNNLYIKDRFNGPKWRSLYTDNTFWTSKRWQPRRNSWSQGILYMEVPLYK